MRRNPIWSLLYGCSCCRPLRGATGSWSLSLWSRGKYPQLRLPVANACAVVNSTSLKSSARSASGFRRGANKPGTLFRDARRLQVA